MCFSNWSIDSSAFLAKSCIECFFCIMTSETNMAPDIQNDKEIEDWDYEDFGDDSFDPDEDQEPFLDDSMDDEIDYL